MVKMLQFGLGNYEDYLFKALVGSSFAKARLMTITTYLLTMIIRFHLSIILCALINGTLFTDLVFPVIVTVLLSFFSGNLYRYIETHKSQYEVVVDYFIDHYSWDNLMMWKRYVLIGIFSYILLALACITIDNYFVFLTTVQAAASFIICDGIENRHKLIRRFKTWRYQPSVVFSTPENSLIVPVLNPTPIRTVSVSNLSISTLSQELSYPSSIPMGRGITPIGHRDPTPPSIDFDGIPICSTPPAIDSERIPIDAEMVPVCPTPPSIDSERILVDAEIVPVCSTPPSIDLEVIPITSEGKEKME